MEKHFKEILEIEDVLGALFLTPDGRQRFRAFKDETLKNVPAQEWADVVLALGEVRAAEVVFEQKRIYFHRTPSGYIAVVTGWFAPMAMVRLNCDVIAPNLEGEDKPARGLGRFFKRS